jgi:hypothetical protein
MEHPPSFTVEEGRPWPDKIPGWHCKNLFIKDRKGSIWLVVMPQRLVKTIGKHARAPIDGGSMAWWRKSPGEFRASMKERYRSKVGRMA